MGPIVVKGDRVLHVVQTDGEENASPYDLAEPRRGNRRKRASCTMSSMARRKPRPASSTCADPKGARPADVRRGPTFELQVGSDGSIRFPDEVRDLMRLEPGACVELEVTLGGAVIRPLGDGHDPEQWWFWTEAWQAGEREIDAARAGGERGGVYMSDADFLAALEGEIAAASATDADV